MKGYRQSRLQQDIAIQCRRTELQARSSHARQTRNRKEVTAIAGLHGRAGS